MKRLVLAAALVLGLTLPAMVQGAIPQPIYFFSNTINPINKQNPLVIRPSGFTMFEDGSWDLQGLRWTGWGSSVAHANGISSASNGIPNQAQGKRIKTPAQVTLSNPGRFQGHEVYRCFTLTVPSHPASDQHLCLTGPHGGYWYLGPASQPKTTPTQPTSGTYARFYTPSRNIACEMSDNGTAQAGIGCIMQQPPALASLKASGVATICQHQGCTGNLGSDPSLPPVRKLPYGSSVTVGRFRCASAFKGVTCVVIATAKGFFISRQSVRTVG
jgi:hypothetical protein